MPIFFTSYLLLFVLFKTSSYQCYIISYTVYETFFVSRRSIVSNNIEPDCKPKCKENGTAQAQLARNIDIISSYLHRIQKVLLEVVSKTYVKTKDALG